MTPADRPGASPDPFDADLSVVHTAVDNLGPWLAIWQGRREPDAQARRCASDAVGAADAALAALHRIRARLVTEARQADDETAARADALLARTRAGPERDGAPRPVHAGGRQSASSPPGTETRTGGPAPIGGSQCPA